MASLGPQRRVVFFRVVERSKAVDVLACLLAAWCCFGLTGCGATPGSTQCVLRGDLQSSAAKTFALTASSRAFTLYPGETATVPIAITAASGGTGTVTVKASNLPQGVTVAPAQVAVGGTASLAVTASANVASSCFTGYQGVFTGTVPLTLEATGPGGTSTMDMEVDIALENPAYTPAATVLPVMRLTTAKAAPVVSEDDYLTGTMVLTDAAGKVTKETLQIKGHGNTTWAEPKKPYRLKLDSRAELLGMASSKNWILLANYDDKSMLRNDVAFQLSRVLGMAWTPSDQFTEVYLNGDYLGVYALTEKVEFDKNRLNQVELDTTDISGDSLTGGYLGEIDRRQDETFTFVTPKGVDIGLDDPDPPVAQQSAYFQQQVLAAEAALYGGNFTDSVVGWPAHFDRDSLVKWYLVNELMGNSDAAFVSSDYFYKQQGDPKLYMGPVWDFNVAAGNDNFTDAAKVTVPWVRDQATWYQQLFHDPEFEKAVRAEWAADRSAIGQLPAYAAAQGAVLAPAAANNFARWPTLGEKVWPNVAAEGTYAGEVTDLKNWIASRIAYMDLLYLD